MSPRRIRPLIIAVLLLVPLLILGSEALQAQKSTPRPPIAPRPSVAPAPIVVYVTKTGDRYHRANCRYLARGGAAINLVDAKRKYTPCLVCNP